MKRGEVGLVLLLAALAFAPTARAQDATPATVAAGADRSTVDALATALAAQITAALAAAATVPTPAAAAPNAPAPAAATPAASARADLRVEVCTALAAAPRGEALVAALLGPALAALRADVRFASVDEASIGVEGADDESAAPARAAARQGYEALVRVVFETRGNYLVARGAVWRTSRGGWHALFRAPPVRIGSPYVRARLDAELRQYVGALPQVTQESVAARAFTLPGRGYVALAAADLDGDGRSELVLARANSVEVVRLGAVTENAPQLESIASATFASTIARASLRPRRTIGTAAADGHTVVLRTSELAASARVALVDGALALTVAETPCNGDLYPLADACALAVPGHDHFAARLSALGIDAPRDEVERHRGPLTLAGFYARALRTFRRPDGTTREVEAVVTPAGRLAIRVGPRPGGAISYGTALALADLEDDGLAEMLVSGAGDPGTGDHLALLRVRDSAQLTAVWQSEPLTGDVWIASSADLDDDGLEEFLAVEEPAVTSTESARLWIVR